MNQPDPSNPNADCGLRIAESTKLPVADSLTDPSLTQFNLPVVHDSVGNTCQVVWFDPVHPKCRVFKPREIADALRRVACTFPIPVAFNKKMMALSAEILQGFPGKWRGT